MERLQDVLKEIKTGLTQKGASAKDEEKIMKAMLNDTEYQVGIYSKKGQIGTYCPAADYKNMISGAISTLTGISKQEALMLAQSYDATKADANTMINISKEFVNTYTETGRKLPFGGRETSNISITKKSVEACDKLYHVKTDNGDGTFNYDQTQIKHIPAHTSAKISAKCPAWLNKND